MQLQSTRSADLHAFTAFSHSANNPLKRIPSLPPDEGHHSISRVRPGGIAEGQLQEGDEVLTVNGNAVAGLSHDEVIEACCEGERQLVGLC